MSTQPMDPKTAGEDLTRSAAAAAVAPGAGDEYITVPLTALVPSPLNPRQRYDDVDLAEMAASMRAIGVIEPLVVRTNRNTTKGRIEPRYEIVAGERRFRAAKLAGLESVPVRIKHLTDPEALEIMVVENLQRKDLDVLEEAAGYRQLQEKGHSVDDLAAKVGKSKAYIYARLKLGDLTKEAQALVADGTLTAGHAILLARLKPADQKRALSRNDGGIYYDHLDTPEIASVRELQRWIDENIVADPGKIDELAPEAAAAVQSAIADAKPVVLITRFGWSKGAWGPAHIVTSNDWKRADGQDKSKECDRAVMGFVAVGPGQGEAFKVCVDKKRCRKHWPAPSQPNAARMGTVSGTPRRSKAVIEREKKQVEAMRKQREREEAERRQWVKAVPAIAAAAAARVKKMPATPAGTLGSFLFDVVSSGTFYVETATRNKAAELVPRGKTAEDLVRHLSFAFMYQRAADQWRGPRDFPKLAKELGVDLKPLLAAVADKEAAPKKAKRG